DRTAPRIEASARAVARAIRRVSGTSPTFLPTGVRWIRDGSGVDGFEGPTWHRLGDRGGRRGLDPGTRRDVRAWAPPLDVRAQRGPDARRAARRRCRLQEVLRSALRARLSARRQVGRHHQALLAVTLALAGRRIAPDAVA